MRIEAGFFRAADSPAGAPFPGLALPDRNGVFEGVDTELCGRKCFSPMRGRYCDDDRYLSHFEPSYSVEEGQPADFRPAVPSGGRHIAEPWDDVLFICLVLQRCHAGPSLGIIADGSTKRDNSPTFGDADPPPGDVDRELVATDGDPIFARWHLQVGCGHEAT